MAFELIFGQSAKPGSWEVCQTVLGLQTTTDLEVFRKKIELEAKKRFPPSATKSELKKLKSTRDGAFFVFNKHEVAFEKCLEIAKVTDSFTEANLSIAIRALNELKRTEEALVYSYMFEHYFHYQSNLVPGFETLFESCYDLEMSKDEVTSTLINAIDKWVSVDANTPVQKRLLCLCDVVFFMLFGKITTWSSSSSKIWQYLARGVEINVFLLEKFQLPINFLALNVFERFEISLLQDVVRHVSSLTLMKRQWLITFVDNLAKVFESTETIAFILAKGGGWSLCDNFKFFSIQPVLPAFPDYQLPSEFGYGDSITWICNASVAVILFGYAVSDRELLERRKVSVPFPMVFRKNSVDWPNDSQALLKLLDLLIFLAVASRADWFMKMINLSALEKIDPNYKSCTRKVYTAFQTTEVCNYLQLQLIKKLRTMIDVSEHLQSFFAQLVARLNFTAINLSLWKVKSIRRNVEQFMVPLALLLDVNDPTIATPRKLAPMLSDKRLREMLLIGFTNLLIWPLKIPCSKQLVDLMAFLLSAEPSYLLRDMLAGSDNLHLRWQVPFFLDRVTAQWEGPRILALIIRKADNSVRRRWTELFSDDNLCIAVKYFSAFIRMYDTSIRARLNQLMVVHGFIRQPAIVPLADILSALDSPDCKDRVKKETALTSFVSNLMPTNPNYFLNAPLAQLPKFAKAFRSIGQVVAGLVFETVISEVRKTDGIAAAHKLANLDKAGRKALTANMKLQLTNFN